MGDSRTCAMKDTEIGQVPVEWEVRSLAKLAEKPQYGLTASAVEENVGPQFLRITDIQNGGVNWPTVPYCECSDADIEKCRLRSGDLVVARIGATTGKTYLITAPPKAIFASYLIRIRTKEQLLPEFLNQFTNSSRYWQQINEAKGGRLKQGVNIPNLQNLKVPLPPLPEQRAIAHVLRTMQRAKEATEKVIAAARTLKQSLMRHLFTYGPVPFAQADQVELKETKVGEIPKQWEVVPLGELARIGNGSTPKRDNSEYWDGGIIPWLTSGKIHESIIHSADQFVTEMARTKCHLPMVNRDSVLVAITGQGKTLGNAALVTFDTCVSQHLAYIQFADERIVPVFMLFFLQSRYNHLRQVGQGGGSTKGALTCGFLKGYSVPVPPKDGQAEIADAIACVGAKLKAEEARRDVFAALFKSLLHNLMTGKVRVHDLDLSESARGNSC